MTTHADILKAITHLKSGAFINALPKPLQARKANNSKLWAVVVIEWLEATQRQYANLPAKANLKAVDLRLFRMVGEDFAKQKDDITGAIFVIALCQAIVELKAGENIITVLNQAIITCLSPSPAEVKAIPTEMKNGKSSVPSLQATIDTMQTTIDTLQHSVEDAKNRLQTAALQEQQSQAQIQDYQNKLEEINAILSIFAAEEHTSRYSTLQEAFSFFADMMQRATTIAQQNSLAQDALVKLVLYQTSAERELAKTYRENYRETGEILSKAALEIEEKRSFLSKLTKKNDPARRAAVVERHLENAEKSDSAAIALMTFRSQLSTGYTSTLAELKAAHNELMTLAKTLALPMVTATPSSSVHVSPTNWDLPQPSPTAPAAPPIALPMIPPAPPMAPELRLPSTPPTPPKLSPSTLAPQAKNVTPMNLVNLISAGVKLKKVETPTPESTTPTSNTPEPKSLLQSIHERAAKTIRIEEKLAPDAKMDEDRLLFKDAKGEWVLRQQKKDKTIEDTVLQTIPVLALLVTRLKSKAVSALTEADKTFIATTVTSYLRTRIEVNTSNRQSIEQKITPQQINIEVGYILKNGLPSKCTYLLTRQRDEQNALFWELTRHIPEKFLPLEKEKNKSTPDAQTVLSVTDVPGLAAALQDLQTTLPETMGDVTPGQLHPAKKVLEVYHSEQLKTGSLVTLVDKSAEVIADAGSGTDALLSSLLRLRVSFAGSARAAKEQQQAVSNGARGFKPTSGDGDNWDT